MKKKAYMKFLAVMVFMMTIRAMAQHNDKINVLIVDGYSNHDWRQTTKVVKAILEKSGLFQVSVSTVPENKGEDEWKTWNPDFKQFDAIIQNTNNIHDKRLRWPRHAERAFEKYLKNGGGLYILHSANNAYPHWDAYNHMIGLGWRTKEEGVALQVSSNGEIIRIPSGQGRATYHGPRNDEVINILNDHPINKGMPKAWKTPDIELYKFARGPAENLTVLSYATDEETNLNWPVDWVVQYGHGRVYNSSFGHLWKGDDYPIGYRCIGFQTTLIRAVQWVATKKVSYPIPQNFPSRDDIRTVQ